MGSGAGVGGGRERPIDARHVSRDVERAPRGVRGGDARAGGAADTRDHLQVNSFSTK